MMDKLTMNPATGDRLLRFVGDRLRFSLGGHGALPVGWQARLRTNLGRAEVRREEILHGHTGQLVLWDASWRDLPMKREGEFWSVSISLTEVGFFRAKAYAVDPQGRQYWPEGPDVGISVHPDHARTANTIYCAFVRLFGATKGRSTTTREEAARGLAALDRQGYHVIPPSGTLRDLVREVPHIMGTLGCRILHLLPVNPVPTTYARFGRFGSPYASQDLLAIDPALVEFDRRTTGLDQFSELTQAVHQRGGRAFLDLAINHTGWGSTLWENHPEWFVRQSDGTFASPGAWGVVWEDLVELHHQNPQLWEYLAGVFLEWCRRGVDGFRCDAGYKIPVPAWRYITSRVLQEFPLTIFLLEGLGGSWQATEDLLTEGGMQWAYSELFQNYSGPDLSRYLDYSLSQSQRVGLYVHYSETHDNNRLAKNGRGWSLLRNRLCALASMNGGFGFTCGVEWLAAEKIDVHQGRGLAWGSADNIIPELAALNRLLLEHPCFFDGANLRRLSPDDSVILAIWRESQEGKDHVLVLVNTDAKHRQKFRLAGQELPIVPWPGVDLLGQPPPLAKTVAGNQVEFALGPGACYCLAAQDRAVGLSGDAYRNARARAAWALKCISRQVKARDIGPYEWQALAALVDHDPARFLGILPNLDLDAVEKDLIGALSSALENTRFPNVVVWRREDRTRVALLPCDHWLLLEDASPFRADWRVGEGKRAWHVQSIPAGGRHVAAVSPPHLTGHGQVVMECYDAAGAATVRGSVLVLGLRPERMTWPPTLESVRADPSALVLFTNGWGGMARLCSNLGEVRSKYDCLLAANLHPSVPVDRHVFAKRVRVWVNADGFITPLDIDNLCGFVPGPPAQWRFVASAGDNRAVEIQLTADMLEQRNTVVLRFERPAEPPPVGRDLDAGCRVALTVRIDIEDRNFHTETHRNGGADHHFNTHCRPLDRGTGFVFSPGGRELRAFSDTGFYHHEPEWSANIPHPVDASRGQVAAGDAFSPGWFELPLAKGEAANLIVSADEQNPERAVVAGFGNHREARHAEAVARAGVSAEDVFGRHLVEAMQAFVVRREKGKTVIAGYPWFLDWGRDSLICGRGLLAAGMVDEVRGMLGLFGNFAERGTLPNSIYGSDASNRDTSDAPLWFGILCEETAAVVGGSLYEEPLGPRGAPLSEALREIAEGYRGGTPNGMRMDPDSALVWSPAHFTWMDTNYPAGTPREGYPVEIQVLWIRLLRQMARLGVAGAGAGESWETLATRAEQSLWSHFWLEEKGYLADLLAAAPDQSVASAVVDDALRSNGLFAISLGLLSGERARRTVAMAHRHLLVPGALRTLAPLPVSLPLPIYAPDGRLLNDPMHPYWGRYEGDEDTRRKPAYHNGTAWAWTFPSFCEALVLAWNEDGSAVSAAKSYLGSLGSSLGKGCLGQIPEILDGDAPHEQRGCDAQAWSVTEAFRVWKYLSTISDKG